MATRPLRSPRRRPQGAPGRDQEGLPQAGARVPPRPQPGRPAGRGALQGGPGRLRHALGPREAQAVRRRRRSACSAAAGPAAAGPGAASPTSATSSPRIFRRGGGGPAVDDRGRDLETEVSLGFDQAMDGTEVTGHRAEAVDLQDLQRHRAQSRARCRSPVPRCDGRGIDSAEPGLLLDQPAVPPVRRRRPDHRGPLPDLRRLRPDLAAQALPGQDPGRRPRRQPGSASPARARTARAAARPATST